MMTPTKKIARPQPEADVVAAAQIVEDVPNSHRAEELVVAAAEEEPGEETREANEENAVIDRPRRANPSSDNSSMKLYVKLKLTEDEAMGVGVWVLAEGALVVEQFTVKLLHGL